MPAVSVAGFVTPAGAGLACWRAVHKIVFKELGVLLRSEDVLHFSEIFLAGVPVLPAQILAVSAAGRRAGLLKFRLLVGCEGDAVKGD